MGQSVSYEEYKIEASAYMTPAGYEFFNDKTQIAEKFSEYKKIQEIIKNPYSKVGMPFTVSLTKLMRKKNKFI
mgnify:CR=1 FL=1